MKVLEMFDLTGKVAVVTGGAGKYGYQIVESLAEAGATVYMASRNRENNLKRVAGLIEAGYKVNVLEFDLEDEKSILALADTVYEREGHVDVLVNNAVLRSFEQEIGRAMENLSALSERTWTVRRILDDADFASRAKPTIIRISRFIQDT